MVTEEESAEASFDATEFEIVSGRDFAPGMLIREKQLCSVEGLCDAQLEYLLCVFGDAVTVVYLSACYPYYGVVLVFYD